MNAKKENPHVNHRKRMKNKYKLHGLDIFEESEILELALFYVVPRKDTRPIAIKLLEKFGSIHEVMEASVSALMEVDGVGEATAYFVKFLVDMARVYLEDIKSSKSVLDMKEGFSDRISLKFIGKNVEAMAIMLLDAKSKILYEGIINEGAHNNIDIYLRKIVELAVLYNASGIVIAHNHPSGIAIPSYNDIETTKRLKNVFSNIGVVFLDHIIVTDESSISMRDMGFGKIFEKKPS